ncbi:hypothetical protein Q5752_000211 [Cryptotrichosporon argae]
MPAVRTLQSHAAPTLPPPDEDGSAGPSFQPFQCTVCRKRFTRHENLKRHALLHSSTQQARSFPCDHCSATFSRLDLRRRHLKNKHPEAVQVEGTERRADGLGGGQPVSGSTAEQSGRGKGMQSAPPVTTPGVPISDLLWSDVPIDWDLAPAAIGDAQPVGGALPNEHDAVDLWRDLTLPSATGHLSAGSASRDTPTNGSRQAAPTLSLSPAASMEDRLTPEETERGVQLFFEHVAHYLPFLHEPTFDIDASPSHLILAMLSIGLQYGDVPEDDRPLATQCFRRSRALLAQYDEASADSAHNLTVVQAYLLLQTAAIMYMCGKETASGLRMHAKSVELARSGGLMEPYPTKPGSTAGLEALWLEFVKAESHKRTLLAVYQLDASWYHILSIPRSLSHLEIKHDMPCSDELWNLSTAAEWAHRSLTRGASSSTRYIAAIRTLLSPSPDTQLPTLDAYGTLNMVHFLLASIREVSGWSTMTGRLSMERFEALRAAMMALEPQTQVGDGADAQDVVVEATWNIAMIELNLWSPSHTNGIVEGSLDGALATATYFATTQSLLISPEIAASVQPYVVRFIRYLDRTEDASLEPPWVAIYAFKAFLVAWQSLQAGWANMLEAVAVDNASDAIEWAKDVFARRAEWCFGKLIETSIVSLAAGADSR